MPYALCPMPYALCPTVPHLSEKGYTLITNAFCCALEHRHPAIATLFFLLTCKKALKSNLS